MSCTNTQNCAMLLQNEVIVKRTQKLSRPMLEIPSWNAYFKWNQQITLTLFIFSSHFPFGCSSVSFGRSKNAFKTCKTSMKYTFCTLSEWPCVLKQLQRHMTSNGAHDKCCIKCSPHKIIRLSKLTCEWPAVYPLGLR